MKLVDDPGDEELSDADDALLKEIFDEYKDYYDRNPFLLVDYLHSILPEYKQVEKGERIPLDYHDILVAGNKPIEEIRAIESQLKSIGWVQQFLKVVI